MIGIEQAREVDDDGELCGPLRSWWAEGHHEPEPFILALVDHIMTEGDGDIPRIDVGDVKHVWRQHVYHGDTYVFDDRPEIPLGAQVKRWRPVTVFDAESRRGMGRCAVNQCGNVAWSRGVFTVRWALDGEIGDQALDVPLCRQHNTDLDKLGYRWRTLFVPIGATVVLPASGEPADD